MLISLLYLYFRRLCPRLTSYSCLLRRKQQQDHVVGVAFLDLTMKKDNRPERRAELAPLDVIRVETALSRYPVHRLAKQGTVCIELREENEKGETSLRWEVSHNSKYGQPGPLAYKLDTLIVNRRIEEAIRPIPKLIRLGGLRDMCRELGLAGSGQNFDHLKKALRQNAGALITAKIKYKENGGTERTLEADFTRYSVICTGERLPEGRSADAVYLILNDVYMQVINGAMTRPIDYGYLRELPPACQRWYELASYAMYAALKSGKTKAKMSYGAFCLYAPQTRYLVFDRVKKQMHKVHAPHRKAGYITGVEFEATTDRDGRPDWTMIYTPGPKAKAEYQAFTRKGGPVALKAEPAQPEPELEPTSLERELIDRGVTRCVAAELVRDFPEELIRAKVDQVDWLQETKPKKVADAGAYLAEAIRKDYAPPAGFLSKAERAEAEATARTQQERREQARRTEARRQEEQARIASYWQGLTPEQRARLDAEALEQADPSLRAELEGEKPSRMRRMFMTAIREDHIRHLLELLTATAG